MQKKVFYFSLCGLILFLTLFVRGLMAYSKNTAMILFNKEPIKKENLLTCSNEFTAGKRLYYIFITEKPLKTEFIRVRILKRDEKANYDITKLFYSNDFKLQKDQVYYYSDYIVMNEAGDYCMSIYAINKLDRPLATADFRIKN